MRERIFEILEVHREDDELSNVYDIWMMGVIFLSLIPLCFKDYTQNQILYWLDHGAALIFSLDYLMRLITADYKLKKGPVSFLLYPLTPMAIIDFLAILPSFALVSSGLRVLKIFRLGRTFRVFKMFRYSKSIVIIQRVINRQKDALVAVCLLALGYIVVCALVVFNVEPNTFENFFEALYWATISLTAVGYGDIYPLTTAGRIITMISSFMGIAIVALPAGIITAGYMDELRHINRQKELDKLNVGAIDDPDEDLDDAYETDDLI